MKKDTTKTKNPINAYTDPDSDLLVIGINNATTVNIRQNSKESNYIVMHTDRDTSIRMNIEQDSPKNYLIINPKDPFYKKNVNIDKPTRSNEDSKDKTENNKYENSTHNDASNVHIVKPETVHVSGTEYNNSDDIEEELNKALTFVKPKNNTKNASKNEPKDDDSDSESGGCALNGSVSGNDPEIGNNSAGPSNFRTFIDKTFIILINITTSILDSVNDIITIL
jgi:hypothetical protein